MIKAIIFDLDGTLLDRNSSLRRFVKQQHDTYLHGHGAVSGDDYIKHFLHYDDNGYVSKEKVYARLKDRYQWDHRVSEELYADYQNTFHDHCVPIDGLHTLMNDLKNSTLKTGLITNGLTTFQNRSIEALGIRDYFDCVLISEEEGIKKPAEQIFERCLKRLDVKAAEAIYVGDHPDNDIRGAARVGLKTIWVENDVYEKPEWADEYIRSLAEIPDRIEVLNRRVIHENQ